MAILFNIVIMRFGKSLTKLSLAPAADNGIGLSYPPGCHELGWLELDVAFPAQLMLFIRPFSGIPSEQSSDCSDWILHEAQIP